MAAALFILNSYFRKWTKDAMTILGLCPKPRLGNFFEKKFPKNLQKTFCIIC